MSKQYIVDKKSIHPSIFCCLSNLSSGTLNCCQASRMTDSSQCVLDLPWDLLQVGYAKSPYLKETQKVPLSDAKTTSTGLFRYGAVWVPHDHTPCLTSKAQPKHPTEEDQFCCWHSWSHSFSHYVKPVVNWELLCLTLSLPQQAASVDTTPICLSVSFSTLPPLLNKTPNNEASPLGTEIPL